MSWKAKSSQLFKPLAKITRMAALRQALLLALLFIALLWAAGWWATQLIQSELSERLDAELAAHHRDLAQQIQNSPDALQNLPNNRFLMASFQTADGQLSGASYKDLFKHNGYANLEFSERGIHNDDWRVFTQNVGNGRLAVALSQEQNRDIQEIMQELLPWMGALVALQTLALGVMLGLAQQKRHQRIIQTLQSIASGNFKARIPLPKVRDDIDDLAHKINQAATQLEQVVQQIQQLSVNLAHDLKTPLARLRLRLEQSQTLPESQLPDVIEQSLTQIDQLMQVFEAILRLGRLSAGEQKAQFKTLSLAQIATESAEIYAAVVEDSGRQLRLTIDGDASIQGDRELLIQLIANLLENFMRHTPQGSEVVLAVNDHILSVSDNGDGIPESEWDRVWEPLYRLDQSRHTAGQGLGLAWVKAIALLHEARVSLSANQPHGLVVRLQFTKM